MGLRGSFAAKVAAGAAGFGVAIAAAPYPVDNVFQMGPLAKRLMKSPAGKVLVRGSQVGGAIAAADFVYSNRGFPRHMVQGMKQGYNMMADHQAETSRDNRTRKGGGGRGRGTSRTRDGPPSLSQRTRKSPSFGKKRRRCKHRNKAGKQCLRPAGHSGRHRYQ